MEINVGKVEKIVNDVARCRRGSGNEFQPVSGESEGPRQGKTRRDTAQTRHGGLGYHSNSDLRLSSERFDEAVQPSKELKYLGMLTSKKPQCSHTCERTILEGLESKFINEVCEVPDAYGKCDAGRGGSYITTQCMPFEEWVEMAHSSFTWQVCFHRDARINEWWPVLEGHGAQSLTLL